MRKVLIILLFFSFGRLALAGNGATTLASIQEVPFIALIEGQAKGRPVLFNGVIIDVNLILTLSPFCEFGKKETFIVRVGSTWLGEGEKFGVDRFIMDPKGPKGAEHFCLLLLDERINFFSNIQRAILPFQDEPFPPINTLLYFSGCGLSNHNVHPDLCTCRFYPVASESREGKVQMGYTQELPKVARATYGDSGAGVYAIDSMVVHGLVMFDLFESSLDEAALLYISYGLFDVVQVSLVRDWLEENRLIYS